MNLPDREYTAAQWEKEFKLNPLGIFLPCPQCHFISYMAYTQNAVPKYCMCKMCGFWQAVNNKPKQCGIFHHDCKGNKQPLPSTGHQRKGFCWGFGNAVSCEYCDELVSKKAKWPAEDPNHPLLKIQG